jgi:hypothetical protein
MVRNILTNVKKYIFHHRSLEIFCVMFIISMIMAPSVSSVRNTALGINTARSSSSLLVAPSNSSSTTTNATTSSIINNTASTLFHNFTLSYNRLTSPSTSPVKWIPALILLKTYGEKLGFETGTESDAWGWGPGLAIYDHNNAQNPPSKTPRLSVSSANPHIEGKLSLKVTVDPFDIANNGARAEVQRTTDSPNTDPHPVQDKAGELF